MDAEDNGREANVTIEPLIDGIFEQVARGRFSEVHFDPFEGGLRIRYRRDGELADYMTLSENDAGVPNLSFKAAAASMIGRLKELAGLDPEVARIPQDGFITRSFPQLDKTLHLRISISPTQWGEKVYLRALGPDIAIVGFERLGLDPIASRRLNEAYQKKGGVIIISGPTGSGKTTTSNAILQLLNNSERNILAAEWPVEFAFSGINHVDCKFDIGYSDEVAMREFLKQKPDVIKAKLENREMSELVFLAAARKNSLVIGNIHVNSAAAVFARLANLGVPSFDTANYIFLSQAQRLVRKLCDKCKEEYSPSPALVRYLKIDEQFIGRVELPQVAPSELTLFRPKGCDTCGGTGYYGRALVCESLKVTPTIGELILHRATEAAITKAAIEEGMLTLRDAGLRQVILGNTSLEEMMIRV